MQTLWDSEDEHGRSIGFHLTIEESGKPKDELPFIVKSSNRVIARCCSETVAREFTKIHMDTVEN